jgi:hypothetical protein
MNRCCCCAREIPDGRQVCSWCESNVTFQKPVESEMSKGELTAEVMRLTKSMMSIECKLSEITIMFIELMKKVAVMK